MRQRTRLACVRANYWRNERRPPTEAAYVRGARCETRSVRRLRPVVAFDRDDVEVHGARAQCLRLSIFGRAVAGDAVAWFLNSSTMLRPRALPSTAFPLRGLAAEVTNE